VTVSACALKPVPRSSAAIKTMRFTANLLALRQSPSPVGRARPRPPFEAPGLQIRQ
jgi:hypothetical protein